MNNELDSIKSAIIAQGILDAANILATDNCKRVTVSNNGRVVYTLWNTEPDEKPIEIVDEATEYPEKLKRWMDYCNNSARDIEKVNKTNGADAGEITLQSGVQDSIVQPTGNLE